MSTDILHIVEGVAISLPQESECSYQPARVPDAFVGLQP